MTTVNVHEAKTNLSQLLQDVLVGQEVTICRYGVPVARLVAATEPLPPQRTGFLPPREVPDDFDDLLADDIADTFEGRTR